jgi:sec-independent protein translocase protein TatC
MDHIRELRQRLLYIVGCILAGGTIAYFFQQQLVKLLLKPSHGQHFIYTSPIGGISFLFNVCTYFGVAISVPVIVYQLLRFIEPVIKPGSKKAILRFSLTSGLLALGGIVFGYIIGLPIALNFLMHQFTNNQIKPLFTISEYLSFVTFYILGSALLFQIPLVISFANRIKPLKPKRLLHYERYVIVVAFIISALMAPTINVISQLVIAVPIIFMYQLAIVMVWYHNRQAARRYSPEVQSLIMQDKEIQLRRASAKLAAVEGVFGEVFKQAEPELAAATTQTVDIDRPKQVVNRFRSNNQRLVDDFRPRSLRPSQSI